jgi:hypothetical protein
LLQEKEEVFEVFEGFSTSTGVDTLFALCAVGNRTIYLGFDAGIKESQDCVKNLVIIERKYPLMVVDALSHSAVAG